MSKTKPRNVIIVNSEGSSNITRTDDQLDAVAIEEVVQTTIFPLVNLCLPKGLGFYFEEQYAQRILSAVGLKNAIPEAETTKPMVSADEKLMADKLLDEIWASGEALTIATLRALINYRDSHLEQFPDRQKLYNYYADKT